MVCVCACVRVCVHMCKHVFVYVCVRSVYTFVFVCYIMHCMSLLAHSIITANAEAQHSNIFLLFIRDSAILITA